jgi:hypothetical protein
MSHVGNGVKQACVLAPTLFSVVFPAMLTDAFTKDDPGLDVRYRTDCKLFTGLDVRYRTDGKLFTGLDVRYRQAI